MRIQFAINSKRGDGIFTRIRYMLLFCVVFLGSFAAEAQSSFFVAPEFQGEWFFDYAQAQERPLNSNQSYAKQAVSKSGISQKNYFSDVPLQITFMGDFLTSVTNAHGSSDVFAVINNISGNSLLEFRFAELPGQGAERRTLQENVEESPVFATFFGLKLSSSAMSMQYNYVYRSGSGPDDYTEGILTIYYKR